MGNHFTFCEPGYQEEDVEKQKSCLLELKSKAAGHESIGGKRIGSVNWSKSIPLKDFSNVKCDEDGFIQFLDLSGTGMSGLDYDLMDLLPILGPHLKHVELGNNPRLTGNMEVMGDCCNLEVFSAPFSDVGGNIRVAARWLRLRKFDVQDCKLVCGDIIAFEDLTDLKELSLYGCVEVKGDVAAFRNSHNLCELKLRHCKRIVGDSVVLEMNGRGSLVTLAVEGTAIEGDAVKSARWLPQYSKKLSSQESTDGEA